MSTTYSKDVSLSLFTSIVDIDTFSNLVSKFTSQNNKVRKDRSLVSLELTSLISLRRSTILNISIRSPSTSNSQITLDNNIIFRSRNLEECEALYILINYSRINNLTFIALQNIRDPYSSSNSLSNRRASISLRGS